jgi:NADH:ubiquinone oxidoreductase subunit 2 (subunit N)
MPQYFTAADYLLSLPILELTLFALGILLVDLWIPTDWKWVNAVTALVGILSSAAAIVFRVQPALKAANLPAQSAYMNSMLVDHFALYFWYLFLAGHLHSDVGALPGDRT